MATIFRKYNLVFEKTILFFFMSQNGCRKETEDQMSNLSRDVLKYRWLLQTFDHWYETCPKNLEITAQTKDEIIMGIADEKLKIFGVQFHPESIASEHGHQLISNFLKIIAA